MLTINLILGNIKKGQSALQVRSLINKLEQSYQKLKLGIKITGCKAETTKCLVYLTMPSESVPTVSYDIVFELHTVSRLLLDTKFKVYTNSASFAYNFAYVFHRLGSLLWPEKFPKEFRELAPKTRNPFYFIGFDKHIYSAIKYISEYGLVNLINEYDGTIPPVKTFEEKQTQLGVTREELKQNRP